MAAVERHDNDDKDSDSDDDFKLSPDVLAAVAEVMATKMKLAESDDVSENWQLSQFWYDDATALKLADEIDALLTSREMMVACVSTPTIMKALNNDGRFLLSQCYVFEFDKRFADKYRDQFVFFDYNDPTPPEQFLEAFEVVVVDPPFLSAECQAKTADYVKKILKPHGKVIICTGISVANEVQSLYKAKKISFVPKHVNGLGNPFACFTNYPPVLLDS